MAGRYQKCLSELVDPSTATFRFLCLTCGHKWNSVFRSAVTRKPFSPDACRIMARVWKGYGRMNAKCPKCQKRIREGGILIGPRCKDI